MENSHVNPSSQKKEIKKLKDLKEAIRVCPDAVEALKEKVKGLMECGADPSTIYQDLSEWMTPYGLTWIVMYDIYRYHQGQGVKKVKPEPPKPITKIIEKPLEPVKQSIPPSSNGQFNPLEANMKLRDYAEACSWDISVVLKEQYMSMLFTRAKNLKSTLSHSMISAMGEMYWKQRSDRKWKEFRNESK